MNRPLQRIFLTVGIITKWRVDWQRSSRSGRSIVEHRFSQLMMTELRSIQGHPLFAIKNSQIDSRFMNDNLEWHYILCRPQVVALDVVVVRRLTVLPSMLLFRINEGVENAENRLYK